MRCNGGRAPRPRTAISSRASNLRTRTGRGNLARLAQPLDSLVA